MNIFGRRYREEGGEGGGDGATASWRDSLPDDLKNHQSLSTTKDVASLAKQFVDQQAYLGNAVRIPSAEASAEDRKAFHDKIIAKVPGLMIRPDTAKPEDMEAFHRMVGRPDKPEEYELVEGLTENDYTKLLRTAAHKQGLNKTQFKEMVAVFPAIAKQLADANAAAAQERKDAVQKEWGAATAKNTTIATSIAEKTGAPQALIDGIKAGTVDIGTLKWLHGLAAAFGGEGKHLSTDSGNSAAMTPAEAASRITEIRRNKEHPVWNPRDPLHATAVKEWTDLHRYANPPKSKVG